MDTIKRRALIQTQDNPNKVNDYIISLEARSADGKQRLLLRYVPDRLILSGPCFDSYIKQLCECVGDLPETAANCLLEDINNELVARWVQVGVFVEDTNGYSHDVIVEDRQPQWDNPHLLSRLSTI